MRFLKAAKHEGNIHIFFSDDMKECSIPLQGFKNNILFKDISSRKVYDIFITNLQQLYTLKIKHDNYKFVFSEEEIQRIFVRPRISVWL